MTRNKQWQKVHVLIQVGTHVIALKNDFVLQARGFCKLRLFTIFLLTMKNLIL